MRKMPPPKSPQIDTVPVTFDPISFKINGERVLLIMGEIHYSRSPRQSWPDLLDRSVAAGLNCIAAYVFWNWHEVRRGVYDFSGDHDLGYFLSLCAERNLYVLLRSGPYCCAEWNYGGYPPYLRNEPDITIRTWNEPYLNRVEKYFQHLVPEFRTYLATNGGPIILVQVENEYANVAKRYGEAGQRYLVWMESLARRLGVDVPVIMCEGGAEGAVETLNGFSIWEERAANFRADHPGMPLIWTELWPAWYNTWGYQQHVRDADNIGYHLLSFIGDGGAGWNYYMWHGGTNFGRTSMYLGPTSYDFDSPLDEYGRPTLKSEYVARIHQVLSDNASVFLNGERNAEPGENGARRVVWKLGRRTIELKLNSKVRSACLRVQGRVVFDTKKDFASMQRAFRSPAWKAMPPFGQWRTWKEPLPAEREDQPTTSAQPIEQLLLTNDETDYCWYSANISIRQAGVHLLEIPYAGDVLSLFVDGRLVARTQPPFLECRGPTRAVSPSRGSEVNALEEQNGNYRQAFRFKAGEGDHRIDILAAAIGLIKGDWMVSGPMNTECKGIWGKVQCDGREVKRWEMRPGLIGERVGIDRAPEAVTWRKAGRMAPPCSWYLTEFPLTKQRLAADADYRLDADGLGKGMLFLNGHPLGRHWLIEADGYGADESWHNKEVHGLTLLPKGQPTQRYYHLPRAWMRDLNVLVIFEEEAVRPDSIRLETRVWKI